MEKQNSFDLKQSNFTYLFLIGSFLCINLGAVILTLLMPQLMKSYALEITMGLQLIAYVPLIIFTFNTGKDVKSVLRLKPINFKQVVLTVLLVLAMYVIIIFVSMLWQILLASLGANLQVEETLNALLKKPAWFTILLLCVYAPFFEEFIFRGMILSGYSTYKGFWKAAVITGIMFGLLHGFLPSVLPTAIVGVVIAALVMATGSIFTGLIYHALHNLLAYTMWMNTYFLDLPWKLNLVPSVDTPQGAFAKFVWILCWTVVAVFAASAIFRSLKKDYVPLQKKPMNPYDKKHRLLFAFALALAVILVLLSSVILFLPKGIISG